MATNLARVDPPAAMSADSLGEFTPITEPGEPGRHFRVLFVDDEPRILDGLRRSLRPQRRLWDMVFACGGPAALDALRSAPFDVVITDLRMPEVDGATLLQYAQQTYPKMIRMVLSGHSEIESMLRVVPVAHQVLMKPCDVTLLVESIERVSNLQLLLQNENLRSVIGRLGSLPSRPRTYDDLVLMLDKPLVSFDDVASVVERDIAMSAKCLQLVNSSFFGLAHRVSSIKRAITYLGLDILKSLMISAEVFRLFDVDPRLRGYCFDALPLHSLHVAGVASRLIAERRQAQNAFMAGMLHDVGKLILATGMPDSYVAILEDSVKRGLPSNLVEDEALGFNHAELGAYLLGIWGLPHPVVEAVAFHHCPLVVVTRDIDAVSAVHIADLLVHEVCDSNASSPVGPSLDANLVESLGIGDRIAGWRSIASEFSAIVSN